MVTMAFSHPPKTCVFRPIGEFKLSLGESAGVNYSVIDLRPVRGLLSCAWEIPKDLFKSLVVKWGKMPFTQLYVPPVLF